MSNRYMDRNRSSWRYDEDEDDYSTRYSERSFEDDRNRSMNRGAYDYGRNRSGYGWQNYNQSRYGSQMDYGDQGYNEDWGRTGSWDSSRQGMMEEGWRGDRGMSDYGYGRSRSGSDSGYGRGMSDSGRSRYGGDYGYSRGMGNIGRSRYGGDYGYTRGRGQGSYGRSRYADDYDWDTDYDQGFDTYDTWEQDFPANWSYTEFWLIPGPETGQGPSGWQRSDERIREDINERLTQHGRLNANNIEVEVDNCTVTLKGTVNNRQMKRMAEDVADSVMGVRDVNNQIKVQDQNQQRSTMQTSGQQTSGMQTGGQTSSRQRQGDNGGQNQPTTSSTTKRK
jgi:osmotically-inducible protein OsmY